MIPVVSVAAPLPDVFPDDFKELLNSMHMDEPGSYVKTDHIIFFIGRSAFRATRRKKQIETKKGIRGDIRLLAQNLFSILKKTIKNNHKLKWLTSYIMQLICTERETITILRESIDDICESEDKKSQISIFGLKSGLKLSMQNLQKLTA